MAVIPSLLVATVILPGLDLALQEPSARPTGEGTSPPALACRLQGTLLAERKTSVADLLSSVTEVEELPDGYAFRFPPATLTELARFVEEERRCCPFFRFELVAEPELGPVWLRLRGPEGVKEVLEQQWQALARASTSRP